MSNRNKSKLFSEQSPLAWGKDSTFRNLQASQIKLEKGFFFFNRVGTAKQRLV